MILVLLLLSSFCVWAKTNLSHSSIKNVVTIEMQELALIDEIADDSAEFWDPDVFHEKYYGTKNFAALNQKKGPLSNLVRAEKHKLVGDYKIARLLLHKISNEGVDSNLVKFKLWELDMLSSQKLDKDLINKTQQFSEFWQIEADWVCFEVLQKDTSYLATTNLLNLYKKGTWSKSKRELFLQVLALRLGSKLPDDQKNELLKGHSSIAFRDSAYHWAKSKKKPNDAMQIMRLSYWKNNGNLDSAWNYFLKIKRKSSLKNYRKQKADLLYNRKKYSQARKEYQLMLKRPNRNKAWAHIQIARTYRAQKIKTNSSAWYRSFRKKFPRHNKTVEMLWTKALEFEQKKKYKQAVKAYKKIDKKFGNHKRRKWVDFRIALIAYKEKKYKQSLALWDKAIKNHRWIWSRNGALLFKGKSYLKMVKNSNNKASTKKYSAEAKECFLKTIKDFPLSYYAFRARYYLKEYNLLSQDSIPKIEILKDVDPFVWLRQKQGVPRDTVDWDISVKTQVEVFLVLGQWSKAKQLYTSQQRQHGKKYDFLLDYAMLFQDYGYLAQSYKLARKLINRLPKESLGHAPRKLLEVMYPNPYVDEVKKAVGLSKVDVYFAKALMRQESIFDDQIKSPAGAIGLMQIMPYTGEALAQQERIPNFDKKMLRNPLMAIRLGIRYLKDLWDDFRDPRWVLANYNAGPGPTKRWKKLGKGKEYEIQVEDVSYWETRDYIKKVMGNYWVYKALYQ